MSNQTTDSDPRIIDSPGQVPAWDHWGPEVRKIVIGQTPGGGGDKVRLPLAGLPADLATRFPQLTHLYLWHPEGLQALPPLPAALACMDLRGCTELEKLPVLPDALETLVLDGCSRLRELPALGAAGLPHLADVSLKGCAKVPAAWIHGLVKSAPSLHDFDASGCTQLVRVLEWAPGLERIELNGCAGLKALPEKWPPKLRRLGLRGASAIARLPDFPAALDFVDLAHTTALKALPFEFGKPRTLLIHGSGLDLPPELFGDSDKDNAASRVLAYLGEAEKGTVTDHEVKVILIGNARCGKSSLLRRLVDDSFDPLEASTHGIRLRSMTVSFRPVDETKDSCATLNLWDFAGQDLYHNTHRTFLQSKAVYVLCRTNHGDGADGEGDERKDPALDRSDDVRRSLGYWREQIASLGSAPGMDGPPPILLVRMKADRDAGAISGKSAWDGCEAGGDLPKFDVSAKSGAGVGDLRKALAGAVAQVLGTKERRSLGKRPMKVQDALRGRKTENEAAFLDGERRGQRIPSPHPTMPRGEFEALVRRYCPESDYARDPGLLLRHFHLSGFLYYDAAYLPETVILDQPWAFEAVYTVMHRGRCHPRLKKSWGRFSPADLSKWAWNPDPWNPEGYTLPEQEVFLKFMESHRVVAKLFEANERDDGQAWYVAPYYLPEWSLVARGVEQLEAPHGPPTAKATIASTYLGRDVAQGLLVDLVRRFSRSAELWKWGAHFAAYSLDAAVTLHWTATSEFDSFGGQIRATYRGSDAAMLHDYLVERLTSLASFPKAAAINFQQLPASVSQSPPIQSPSTPGRELPAMLRGTVEAGSRAEAVGVRVAISYAGSSPAGETEEERNLGALPKALAAYLRSPRIRVLEYSEKDRESNLARFIEDLVKQDYLVIFLSKKYFHSPYCMWELKRLFQEPPPHVFPPGRALFLAMPGVPLADEGELMTFRTVWHDYWTNWCAERKTEAKAAAHGDPEEYLKCLRDMLVAPWYEFASNEDLRRTLLNAVFADCFKLTVSDPAAFQPGTQGFAALTERFGRDVTAALEKSETVYQMAARLWQRAGRELGQTRGEMRARAKQLYHRARRLEPGFDHANDLEKMASEPHISNHPEVEDLLEELRRTCLGDAQNRAVGGGANVG